jgi:hypothetical protein
MHEVRQNVSHTPTLAPRREAPGAFVERFDEVGKFPAEMPHLWPDFNGVHDRVCYASTRRAAMDDVCPLTG